MARKLRSKHIPWIAEIQDCWPRTIGATGLFELAVELEVSVPERDTTEIQELANIAHAEVCPYSRATRGNIEVKVRVV
jgi:organic hydroperoxide reductase OsmC/OhrA